MNDRIRSPFDCVSPMDARYYGQDPQVYAALHDILSEEAAIRFQALVEVSLLQQLAEAGLAPPEAAEHIQAAAAALTPQEVIQEEDRIQHNIRALVNCLRRRMPPETRRFVHLFATSNDILDTTAALRYRAAVVEAILPAGASLLRSLIALALRTADVPQIGRTHGRFAEPVTLGFSVALFVDRLGHRLWTLRAAARGLTGKLSGAVGASNGLSLVPGLDPLEFERQHLARLGLTPGAISSQIVQPEPVADLVHAAVSTFGVLANVADDFRHLCRSEIGELEEDAARKGQVGSSTMPHKINPKNFEHVKSLWKAYVPRGITAYLDQISEHQRDLTNSASARYVTELLAGLCYGIVRLDRAVGSVVPNLEALARNLEASRDQIGAEPLYLALSLAGHPDAHQAVQDLARRAMEEGKAVEALAAEVEELAPYLAALPAETRAILEDPRRYTGTAPAQARAVCQHWAEQAARLQG